MKILKAQVNAIAWNEVNRFREMNSKIDASVLDSDTYKKLLIQGKKEISEATPIVQAVCEKSMSYRCGDGVLEEVVFEIVKKTFVYHTCPKREAIEAKIYTIAPLCKTMSELWEKVGLKQEMPS